LLLNDAKRQAGEAVRLGPADSTATDLYSRAGAALQAADAVVSVTPQTVTTLSRQVTGEVLVDRIVVAPGIAYLLDGRGRRILGLALAGGGPPQAIFENGAAYGGTTARTPVALAWDDREGRLLVLDSERKLYEVRPGGTPQPLAVRRSAAWGSVAAIAAYDGNLYVLDNKGRQVAKYLPAASGFDSEPASMLGGSPAIASGNSLAVTGDLFVLGDDGKVHRFVGGTEAAFGLGGIDRALVAPRSIAAQAGRNEIYVADAGNKRVVVAGSDGVFKRQLVSTTFTDLRAIALDQAGTTLYAVAGDAVLSMPITAVTESK
jgi:DNA-binding beta-propeller fold protein YncE